MGADPVTAIAGAIRDGFKLIALAISGSEKRRMRKAIEAAERLIRRYEDITPKSKRDKDIRGYIKDFFKDNN